jgi:hypothetical protein
MSFRWQPNLLGNEQERTQHSPPPSEPGSSRWRSDPLHGDERRPTRRLGCMGVASVVQPADFVVLGNDNQQPDAGLPQARLRPRARTTKSARVRPCLASIMDGVGEVTLLWRQRHAPGLALKVLLRHPPLRICTCQPGQLRLPGGRIDGTLPTRWSIRRD